MKTELRFVIDALNPETLSLGRLVAYLGELSKLLGDDPDLHFDRIDRGSAVLVAWADEPARPKLDDRLARVRVGDGPIDAAKALGKLNELLREDNAVGALQVGGAEIIPFPGRNLPRVETIGPVQQPTTVEGQLIRIGGKDRTVHFYLADRDRLWKGETTRHLARGMGQHLFGPTLRVTGSGTWHRDSGGTWTLGRFQASNFEVLDDAPLAEALARLRAAAPGRDGLIEQWRDLRGVDDTE
ncbi:hypothetical protein [Azospirillum sp.]|uniref:hypothetical protein n=1 Tax=Azospirillum sp. TaxID=34012 RepID=UPI002D4E197C|nr:hypothetical protein [Azospirillum sp.]HYF87914.1 hypothetical protein [Azospirillum sp.]